MKGKKVRCVQDEATSFILGATYTLAEDQRSDGKWCIEGWVSGTKWWNMIRFVSIQGVRCLDNGNWPDDGDATNYLRVGQVYTVLGAESDYHYKIDLPARPGYPRNQRWHTTRFEQVWNDPISKPKNYDPDEESCWMLMRPHIGPDECICGIKRVMCDYHRVSGVRR